MQASCESPIKSVSATGAGLGWRRADWEKAAQQHRAQAERWTLPYRQRKQRNEPHPVLDFLFVYYNYAPSLLERWHPGYGSSLALEGAPPLPHWSERHYSLADGGAVQFVDPQKMSAKTRERLSWVLQLLQQTQRRPANFGCFGLHEWAMVYRADAGGDIRHQETLPLRLPLAEINAFVESRAICCSHFDAFRFFTPKARPLNRFQPSFDTRQENEQGGCLHANMDLYKWAAKATPWVSSQLLLACFELAVKARELDMRASPYDVSAFGYDAVAIETLEGRALYENLQREVFAIAKTLRTRLQAELKSVLHAAS